jgi:uncharacterized protein
MTMTGQPLIDKTIEFVQQTLDQAEGGHDWWHTYRVWQTAKTIAASEQVNLLVVELGALLHDIADAKFHQGDEILGPNMAKAFLLGQEVETSIIEHVTNIVRHISFKSSLSYTEQIFSSPELKVVQDADRLDAIGAIGIARAFNYGGYRNRALYDPGIPPNVQMTKNEYMNSTAPTINHFYEKLLLLKDKMNTDTGRRMAEARHIFMEQYLEQFYKEWEGVN